MKSLFASLDTMTKFGDGTMGKIARLVKKSDIDPTLLKKVLEEQVDLYEKNQQIETIH